MLLFCCIKANNSYNGNFITYGNYSEEIFKNFNIKPLFDELYY